MGINSQFTSPGTGITQGAILNWDPLANIGEDNYHIVQAGVSSKNNYAIVKNPIGATLDNVPIGTVNAIISYVVPDGWTIISATANQARYTTPASVADEAELNSTFPDPSLHDGEYCYVESTATYWSPILEGVTWSWYDTNQSTVDSYSKTEIDNIINSISNEVSAVNATLTTDNASFDDFQKITDAIEAIQLTLSVDDTNYDTLQKITDAIKVIQSTLSVDDANYDTLQEIVDKLKVIQSTLSVDDANYDTLQEVVNKLKDAETKLATIETGAEVNVQSDWSVGDNTDDAFIKNKPTLGTASSKNVGTAVGDIQENGAILANSEVVETDATGKFITAAKNTAYNKNFGTTATDVATGDASYLKADTYTKLEIDNALDAKEAVANKGVANGYASLDGNAQVPLSQIPSLSVYFNKTADTTDNITEGTAKFTTQTDIDKLTGIQAGATANSTDATLLNRANHTGTQPLSTISDSGTLAAKNTIATDDVDNNAITTAKIQQFASKTVVGRTSPGVGDAEEIDIATLKTDLALNNVANVDTTTTANIADSADKRYVTDAEKTIIGNTSGTNTGDETTLSIQTKRPLKTVEGQSLEGPGDIDLAKSDVGLANVNNTSDADKPVSTAQQTALDTKLAKASDLSDVANRQAALDNLTDVSNATNEQVLTKDTATGKAIFKPIPSLQALLPTGSIVMSIASSLSGALKFDGVSSYSKTTYSSLYTLISSLIGASFDVDANNFYLPDPTGRVLGIAGSGRSLFDLAGSDTHALSILEIASHTHNLKLHRDEGSQIYGGFVPDESFTNAFSRNTSNGSQDAGTLLTDRQPNTVSHTTESVGSGQAHNIVQKTAYIGQNLFIYF